MQTCPQSWILHVTGSGESSLQLGAFTFSAGTHSLCHLTARVQTFGTTLQDAPPPHISLAIHEGGHSTGSSATFPLMQCLSRFPGLRMVSGAGYVASVKRRVFSFKKDGLLQTANPQPLVLLSPSLVFPHG